MTKIICSWGKRTISKKDLFLFYLQKKQKDKTNLSKFSEWVGI
jgi:hypothetical protein